MRGGSGVLTLTARAVAYVIEAITYCPLNDKLRVTTFDSTIEYRLQTKPPLESLPDRGQLWYSVDDENGTKQLGTQQDDNDGSTATFEAEPEPEQR